MHHHSGHIVRKFTPEEEELERKRAELAALEDQLADRELELSTLQIMLEQFRARYLSVVGSRYAELDSIEAEIAQIVACRNPADAAAQTEASERRRTADESARESDGFEDRHQSAERFAPSAELKSLFRTAAKKLHPDLGSDDADRARRHKAMTAVNKAYKEGDEETVRRILADWDSSPDNVVGQDIGAELVRAIRNLHRVQQRFAVIENEIRQLRVAELFSLYEQCKEAEEEGRDMLGEIAKDIDNRIKAAKQRQREVQEQ